ncbi:MAG: hypothetical protein FJ304_15095 [Planctomycetes bacterium]|nr:hypothetical protein [Planctomycetota bacterium]
MELSELIGDIPESWAERARELAGWALERIFVRTDRCGGYYLDRGTGEIKKTTCPTRGPKAGHVSPALVERHFRARECEDVIGAHALAPGSSVGRWCAIDVDNHADLPDLPRANREFAEERYAVLAALGFRPLVADYGGGSVHFVILFDRELPGAVLQRFAEWVRDGGGARKDEVFPKQEEVPADGYGNWLRLVGRHFKRDVWAKVFDGERWLEGAAAVSHVLSLVGDSPDLIPEHVLRKPEPKAEPKPKAKPEPARTSNGNNSENIENVFETYNARATLDELIAHCEAQGHKLLNRTDERATFTRAGKKDGESFNLRKMNGTVFLKNFSCNSGLPEGKGRNPAHTRCALWFGEINTHTLAQTALRLEAELGLQPSRMPLTVPFTTPTPAPDAANPSTDDPEPQAGDGTNPPAWWQPPMSGETWTDPHRLARLFVRATATPTGAPSLVQWRDEVYRWLGGAYRVMGEGDLGALLYKHAREVFVYDLPKRRAEALAAGSKAPVKLPPVAGRVRSDTRGNLSGLVLVPDDGRDAPFWLRSALSCDPRELVVAPNGLFAIEQIARGEGALAAPTPDLFALNALPFDVPLGECDRPRVWVEKLKEWFAGDTRAILGLQEWIGYLLSGDSSQHKILLLVGPPRSGKGTILRVLSSLIGAANVATTSFAALGESFGLQDLIGKRVAVIPDARLSGRTDTAQVVERLLSVSGGDAQTVNRKNLPRLTTKLGVRFVLATNEIPRLADASGALASRFHILALPNSFLGREDKALDDKLAAELPAILQWAAKGYVRLRTQGAFTENDAAKEHVRHLEELSSPVRAFVRECCRMGPTEQLLRSELYNAWCAWCEDRAIPPSADNIFGRDLRAACPHVADAQLRSIGGRVRVLRGIGLRQRDDWGDRANLEGFNHAS